jgi:hypothetical protein
MHLGNGIFVVLRGRLNVLSDLPSRLELGNRSLNTLLQRRRPDLGWQGLAMNAELEGKASALGNAADNGWVKFATLALIIVSGGGNRFKADPDFECPAHAFETLERARPVPRSIAESLWVTFTASACTS